MNGNIAFDKQIYMPGESVRVSFSDINLEGGNVRQIEIILTAYEKVKVTYTSGAGETSSTHTAIEQQNYAIANQVIEANSIAGSNVLEIVLPPDMPSTFNYKHQNLEVIVALEAEIKFDIPRAIDKHIRAYANIQASPVEVSQPVSVTLEGIKASLPGNLLYPGMTTNLTLNVMEYQKKYRGVRLELTTVGSGTAQKHSTKSTEKEILFQTEKLESGNYPLQIPGLSVASSVGQNYSISHMVKVVIDRAFARDDNLIIPITAAMNLSSGSIESKSDTAIYDQANYQHQKSDVSIYSGFSSSIKEKSCKNCVKVISLDAKKCPYCGAKQ